MTRAILRMDIGFYVGIILCARLGCLFFGLTGDLDCSARNPC